MSSRLHAPGWAGIGTRRREPSVSTNELNVDGHVRDGEADGDHHGHGLFNNGYGRSDSDNSASYVNRDEHVAGNDFPQPSGMLDADDVQARFQR